MASAIRQLFISTLIGVGSMVAAGSADAAQPEESVAGFFHDNVVEAMRGASPTERQEFFNGLIQGFANPGGAGVAPAAVTPARRRGVDLGATIADGALSLSPGNTGWLEGGVKHRLDTRTAALTPGGIEAALPGTPDRGGFTPNPDATGSEEPRAGDPDDADNPGNSNGSGQPFDPSQLINSISQLIQALKGQGGGGGGGGGPQTPGEAQQRQKGFQDGYNQARAEEAARNAAAGAQPGGQPSAEPGAEAGAQPAAEPGAQPAAEPGAQPGDAGATPTAQQQADAETAAQQVAAMSEVMGAQAAQTANASTEVGKKQAGLDAAAAYAQAMQKMICENAKNAETQTAATALTGRYNAPGFLKAFCEEAKKVASEKLAAAEAFRKQQQQADADWEKLQNAVDDNMNYLGAALRALGCRMQGGQCTVSDFLNGKNPPPTGNPPDVAQILRNVFSGKIPKFSKPGGSGATTVIIVYAPPQSGTP